VARPFLQCHHRFKKGKDHCSWSIAEKVPQSKLLAVQERVSIKKHKPSIKISICASMATGS